MPEIRLDRTYLSLRERRRIFGSLQPEAATGIRMRSRAIYMYLLHKVLFFKSFYLRNILS